MRLDVAFSWWDNIIMNAMSDGVMRCDRCRWEACIY